MTSIQTKSMLIVLLTLLIGMAIGLFIGRLLWAPKPWEKKFSRLDDPRLFLRLQDELLRPTETQRDTLGIISKRYFFDLQKTAKRHRTELQAIVDSMRREIEPLLTPEQLERFKRPREGFPGPGWRPMRIPRQPHPEWPEGRPVPPAGTPPPPPEPQE